MKGLFAGIFLLSLAVPGYPAEWTLLETSPDGMMLYMKRVNAKAPSAERMS